MSEPIKVPTAEDEAEADLQIARAKAIAAAKKLDPGVSPFKPKQEAGLNWEERTALKNFGPSDIKSQIEWLGREQGKGGKGDAFILPGSKLIKEEGIVSNPVGRYDAVEYSPGKIAVRPWGAAGKDKPWKVVDPDTGLFSKDLPMDALDLVYDVARSIPGGKSILGSAAAMGVSGGLKKAISTHAYGFKEDPLSAGIETGLEVISGGIAPPLAKGVGYLGDKAVKAIPYLLQGPERIIAGGERVAKNWHAKILGRDKQLAAKAELDRIAEEAGENLRAQSMKASIEESQRRELEREMTSSVKQATKATDEALRERAKQALVEKKALEQAAKTEKKLAEQAGKKEVGSRNAMEVAQTAEEKAEVSRLSLSMQKDILATNLLKGELRKVGIEGSGLRRLLKMTPEQMKAKYPPIISDLGISLKTGLEAIERQRALIPEKRLRVQEYGVQRAMRTAEEKAAEAANAAKGVQGMKAPPAAQPAAGAVKGVTSQAEFEASLKPIEDELVRTIDAIGQIDQNARVVASRIGSEARWQVYRINHNAKMQGTDEAWRWATEESVRVWQEATQQINEVGAEALSRKTPLERQRLDLTIRHALSRGKTEPPTLQEVRNLGAEAKKAGEELAEAAPRMTPLHERLKVAAPYAGQEIPRRVIEEAYEEGEKSATRRGLSKIAEFTVPGAVAGALIGGGAAGAGTGALLGAGIMMGSRLAALTGYALEQVPRYLSGLRDVAAVKSPLIAKMIDQTMAAAGKSKEAFKKAVMVLSANALFQKFEADLNRASK